MRPQITSSWVSPSNQIDRVSEAAHTRTAAAKPVLRICRRVVLVDSATIRTSSEALLEARTMPLVLRAATLLCRTDEREEEEPKVIGRAHVARVIFSVFCEELSSVFGWTEYSYFCSLVFARRKQGARLEKRTRSGEVTCGAVPVWYCIE